MESNARSRDFEVVVSHPSRQGFVDRVAMAIQRQGIPVRWLTGLYYREHRFPYSLVGYLPKSRRARAQLQLVKRRVPELDDQCVISLGGPWLEAAFRPRRQWWLWWKIHDWLVSRWIASAPMSPNPTILHTFDGYTKRAFSRASRRGWTRVLEITLPLIADDLVGAEYRRLGWPIKQKEKSPAQRKEAIECYRMADFLVAQSRLTVDYLTELEIPRQRIILMPLGVDTERFVPGRSRTASDPFRALFVGQLGIRKGLHLLLEAWQQLDLPAAELLLAGGTSEDRESISKLLQTHAGCFRWLGFLDHAELVETYHSGDIFVLPALAEGSSMVLHEAMASGLPCVVTENVGCTLRNGIEGFSIPVGDVEALKDSILRLYRDPELRQRMGLAARARAEQFSWREYGRRLALMYRTIVDRQREAAEGILDLTEL